MNSYTICLKAEATIMTDIYHIIIGTIVCIALIFDEKSKCCKTCLTRLFTFVKNSLLGCDYEPTFV